METATAPDKHLNEPNVAAEQNTEPDDVFQEPDISDETDSQQDETEPEEEQTHDLNDDFEEIGYIAIDMGEEEISQGFLVLVNRDHAFELPAPLDLVNIVEETETTFRVLGNNYLLRRSVAAPLDEMMAAFISETGNRNIAIISAFRNYNAQQHILDDHIRRMGRTEALRWASLPGHSEHHTALAIDFGIFAGGTRSTFDGTGVTSWFSRNSYNFGFILRYPENKTHITQVANEPWHFRYVGLPHSIIINQNNWVLEEYLETLREYTFEEPFQHEQDGILYEIYFSAGTQVKVPLNSEFEISGNNIDGFIVTLTRLPIDPDAVTDISI